MTISDIKRSVLTNGVPGNFFEQRAGAAAFYRDVATRTVGREAAAASRYNIARAEFLEGTRSQLSPTLPEFIKHGF